MRCLKSALIGVLFVLAFQAGLQAQEEMPKLPDPARGYDWRKAAGKTGLGPKEIEQLDKDRILVTNEAFKQVFTPYLGPDVPVEPGMPLFITSDSLLNGFHVLYEESVLRLEQANARRLSGILKFIWRNLQTAGGTFMGKPELVASAKTRARVLVATAMRLLGDEPAPLDATTASLVKEEVDRVEAARGQSKPKWLGPPDRGFMALDYTRYQPRGFYTKTPVLKRYFRAVSWLQSVPFRVSNDEELVSILMLGPCAIGDGAGGKEQNLLETFFQTNSQLVGQGDDWDLIRAGHVAAGVQYVINLDFDGMGLASVRKDLSKLATKQGERPQINDQLAFAPDDPAQTAELTFRVLPARRTPDAVAFQRTTDQHKFERHLPTGLEVCALLGSPYARSRLAAEENGKLLAEIDRCKSLFACESPDGDYPCLYREYMRCLETLLAKPEPDAPHFMWTEAWQIKSCQTVLGGWAQLRHTWALQAKESEECMGGEVPPPGFVEPVPEFFARLAALVEETEDTLRKAGALTTDRTEMAADIREAANLLEKRAAVGNKSGDLSGGLSPDEMKKLSKSTAIVDALAREEDADADKDDLAKLLKGLRKLADDLEQGRSPAEGPVAEAMKKYREGLGDLWQSLGIVCRRLETLAHKQLRGATFSENDNWFICSYGEKLAEVMLYNGNSYLMPNDDAPRVVDVFSSPQAGKFLEVGIARPRAIYVLYPFKGGEILCRGAVMPYYEFTHDARLTDAEWKTLLDSAQRPRLPAWMSPIIAPSGLSAPKLKPDE
jgi:hypothetical protein